MLTCRHDVLLTCSCEAALFYRRLELAYFAGKISKIDWSVKNAVALTYYRSCRLVVMDSCMMLVETEPRKADRTVGVSCYIFSNISTGTA